MPLRLLSTDFDGTLFAELQEPPVATSVQAAIGRWQAHGARWIINTGRDLASLTDALGRARLAVQPDFLVLVEREIYQRDGGRYVGLTDWNGRCARSHEEVFARIRPALPRLAGWVRERFAATVYEDPYSPFCLIAGNNTDADAIQGHLDVFCLDVPGLVVVRNDVYMRFSHADFNKGTALAEVSRRLGVPAEAVFAAGDHLNDLPMLDAGHARWLAAPANAVPQVKQAVRRQGGHVSGLPHGDGVAEALESLFARRAAAAASAPRE